MFDRSYSGLLEIDGHLVELIGCLADPNPSDEQLFAAQGLLRSILDAAERMEGADGYREIHGIASRLERAVVTVRRFHLRLDTRWHTAVERALHVLTSVVASRLSDHLGDSNVRQCEESLDALIASPGRRTVTATPAPRRRVGRVRRENARSGRARKPR